MKEKYGAIIKDTPTEVGIDHPFPALGDKGVGLRRGKQKRQS